ncbi:MAG: MoaD/ThiS family protein [Candidatus Rokubacteria bacterium]|nr:MoaD/ThiS family protein [Candidatus Rokubacteria bacterium]
MTIDVQLFATLARYLPPDSAGDAATLEIPEGTRVGDVIRLLGIPATMPRIVLVNGEDADDERVLQPRDVLSLVPPLAGGCI